MPLHSSHLARAALLFRQPSPRSSSPLSLPILSHAQYLVTTSDCFLVSPLRYSLPAVHQPPFRSTHQHHLASFNQPTNNNTYYSPHSQKKPTQQLIATGINRNPLNSSLQMSNFKNSPYGKRLRATQQDAEEEEPARTRPRINPIFGVNNLSTPSLDSHSTDESVGPPSPELRPRDYNDRYVAPI